MTEAEKAKAEVQKWMRLAIKDQWGARCNDYYAGCRTCMAWKLYDKAMKERKP